MLSESKESIKARADALRKMSDIELCNYIEAEKMRAAEAAAAETKSREYQAVLRFLDNLDDNHISYGLPTGTIRQLRRIFNNLLRKRGDFK